MNLLDSDYKILHHALGISAEQRKPYRNHYVTGDGCSNMQQIQRLCAAGLMVKAICPGFLSNSDQLFLVTEEGRNEAMRTLPNQPTLTRSQKRYRRYLQYGSDESFIDWMRNPCGRGTMK